MQLLKEIVERLRTRPDLLLAELRAIREDEKRRAEVAGRSCWHSNGFAKIRLVEYLGFCLRLHVWPAGPDKVPEVNPHGHRWDFASWIVVGGGVRETYYHETDVGHPDASIYVRCAYKRKNNADFLRPLGAAWLRAYSEQERGPGTVYGCHRGLTHTVAPVGDALLATLVLQAPGTAAPTAVYIEPDRSEGGRARPIGPHELRRLLGDVDEAITAKTVEPGPLTRVGVVPWTAPCRATAYAEDACAPHL